MKLTKMHAAALAAAALLFGSAGLVSASHQECGCATTTCSPQGFEISLVNFQVDQLNGVSEWIYQVCNDSNLSAGADVDDCIPPKDLSHIDIVLPGLGECVSATGAFSIAQVGGADAPAILSCSVSNRDPACPAQLCAPNSGGKFCVAGTVNSGEQCNSSRDCNAGETCTSVPCQPIENPDALVVLKCDVADPTNLDAGECVVMKVTIAGEQPTIGQGTIDNVTKAGPECSDDRICGPACGCATVTDECLTRTAGFWGTHPGITGLSLPVSVCGKPLTVTSAGTCDSATEALCVSPGLEANRKLDRNPQYAELVRQLTAAKLNLAATAANGGACGAAISTRIAECEALCAGTKNQITNSNCIADLDAFNNSQDTFAVTPAPFDSPGAADPSSCQEAHGNTIVIGKKCLL